MSSHLAPGCHLVHHHTHFCHIHSRLDIILFSVWQLGTTKSLTEKMKIFNWMHRKLNHNILKDGFARNVKKTESVAIDTNTKALLEQVALVDMLDGWRDGVLTIGTFGFDPLKPFDDLDQQKEEYFFSEESEEEEADDDDEISYRCKVEDEEEINPLIGENNNEEISSTNAESDHEIDCVPLTPPASTNELNKRRTTLAELFSDDDHTNWNKAKPEANGDRKQATRPKNGLSFAKKFIKEDSRPIKKLHKMMRRMLKRKIHPELDGKAQVQNKATPTIVGEAAAESVSLLQIPAGTTA